MIEALLVGLCGLLLGSFLNVCVHRMPRDLSVVRPRSYCPACEAPIAWYDNIPVLSYVLLHARCRKCGARISFRYPLVELLTGGLFFLYVYGLGMTGEALKYCLFSFLLVGLIFSDIEERILPDEFTLGGWLAGLGLAWFVPLESDLVGLVLNLAGADWPPRAMSLAEAVVGSMIPALGLWMCGALYEAIRHREGLGFGDVKMVGCLGAFLGLRPTLLIFFLGSMAGAVLGLVFILLRRKDVATFELPFGSFLGGAALLVAAGMSGMARAVFGWPAL
jgi:leader peptidase (prepilin peptidase)/N-methyltransferase